MEVEMSTKYSHLDETRRGWILQRPTTNKKNKHINLGIMVCSYSAVKWAVGLTLLAFVLVGIPIIVKLFPKPHKPPPPPDDYTAALNLALRFFNAQKCKT